MNRCVQIVGKLSVALAIWGAGCISMAFAAGEAGSRTIRDIHIEGTAFAAVFSSGSAFANPDNCGSSNVVIIQTSDAQYNQKLALALSALAQGTHLDFC